MNANIMKKRKIQPMEILIVPQEPSPLINNTAAPCPAPNLDSMKRILKKKKEAKFDL
ncbi:MAG: hypothetical protein WA130_15515 [Candidatus Methanoperedens sp.]